MNFSEHTKDSLFRDSQMSNLYLMTTEMREAFLENWNTPNTYASIGPKLTEAVILYFDRTQKSWGILLV